eukprot:13629715-Alexandrium_andersonii.AAC.1
MSLLTCSAHEEAKALALSRSTVDESCISVRASDKEEQKERVISTTAFSRTCTRAASGTKSGASGSRVCE